MNNQAGGRKLKREERVKWFFLNYYETGMEYSYFSNLSDDELDNLEWYGEKIQIPKYLPETGEDRKEADLLLQRYEDENEFHFHEVDRKWIIDCMLEFKQKKL